ncbi:uncharacterized protein TRIVIDRAFT_206464 [Trichoderma virens Gv29-8]|uniref:Uncharacterized protein n=1 Tax=Hypocrea virens (strain Gv29-8 / FGSC 10586) TaxID=413071 RepID=G9NAC1_HYPVG|nr:uncharacterized protein TRIVIDRAFT_206464 [Trichoderma virens Gv29-8]EHK16887.1 hypothetical protein TRIVIDRAFT_206464 [Trichoderma virens Gv29-8]UKZ51738.1 hypothetical protein TrVGV298_005501 [Trichoderma virens]
MHPSTIAVAYQVPGTRSGSFDGFYHFGKFDTSFPGQPGTCKMFDGLRSCHFDLYKLQYQTSLHHKNRNLQPSSFQLGEQARSQRARKGYEFAKIISTEKRIAFVSFSIACQIPLSN